MEKQRLFKMDETERNVLIAALHRDMKARKAAGQNPAEFAELILRADAAPERKLYLDEQEYRIARNSLNGLRNSYLAAGRYSDGIDAVMCKLINSKYKRTNVR